MFDGSHINIFVAFIGGVITFFASCLLPLVPVYLAYLAGVSISDRNSKQTENIRWKIFGHSLLFVIGFITTFVILGAAVVHLSSFVQFYKPLIQKIGGFLFIIFGLHLLDLIEFEVLAKEYKFKLPQAIIHWKKLNSLCTGIIFGFAWTPCIGPVLATILFWAGQTDKIWQGMSLLFVYGLGLGLPFLFVGLFFEYLSPKLTKAGKLGHQLQKLAGIIILIVGIFLLLGKVEYLSVKLLESLHLRTLAM